MKKSIIFILLVAVIAGGCRPKYTAMKTSRTETPVAQKLTISEIVNQCNRANSEIRTLNISNAEVFYQNDEKSYTVKMTIRIIKGKEISISIFPALGIELFRIKFTPERFYVFDKFNRQYCDNSYDYFTKILKTEVTYAAIEALLTNKLFCINKNESIETDYASIQKPEMFLLESKRQANGYEHRFEISPDYMIASTVLKDRMTEAVRVDYTVFKVIDKVAFPTLIELKTNLPKDNFNMRINIKKAEINGLVEPSPVDFGRYTKVMCSQIL